MNKNSRRESKNGTAFGTKAEQVRLEVEAAKQRLRLAKEQLKRARKLHKEAKRIAKRARKKAAAIRKELKRKAKATQTVLRMRAAKKKVSNASRPAASKPQLKAAAKIAQVARTKRSGKTPAVVTPPRTRRSKLTPPKRVQVEAIEIQPLTTPANEVTPSPDTNSGTEQ